MNLEDLITDFAHSLGSWAYLLVAFMATAETAAFLGFIAPGEFTIILGGVLAGEGTLSIWILIGVVWASIVVGDSIGFMLGRRLGRSFITRHGHRVRLTEERVQKVEAYFGRHGGKTIFFGRWIGFVRPLMPFTAGTSGMAYKTFLPYDVLSAGLFGSFFCLLGYIFWHSFDRLTSIAGKGALGLGVLVGLIVGGYLLWKRLRDPEQRRKLAAFFERLGRRPLVRPFAAVLTRLWRLVLVPAWHWVVAPVVRLLRPPLRFVGQRLTPGGLGIELTTLLAVAAVSAYVFGLYTDMLTAGNVVTTPGDRAVLEFVQDINGGFLTALAKVVTVFGSWPVITLVVLVAAGVFLWFRRSVDAALLLIGYGLVQAAVNITKPIVDRARPPDGLVEVSSAGFPSGHAATAVAYLVLAVLIARALPNLTWRVALLAGGVAAAVLIGLSRIYLQVHYMSDVTSGWALGLGIFCLCGAIALIASYLRKNEPAKHAPLARPASNPSDG
jgi:membrane protein DedA with SNARE-associated domain/membrane-associated phospholipid phosphatase